ncbi:MAG: lipocalin-like domain-containing protein [Bryobacteraceae bacterium]
MKTLALLAIFAVAKPGYRYEFPRDHFAHPEFKTEWWYFTGNLRDETGRRFGFELTFFRQARGEEPRDARSVWDANEVWLAHLTLSDIAGGRFLHEERVNRAGPGLAGAREGVVWNGNWSTRFGSAPESMDASTAEFRLQLRFSTKKPAVIHGENGVSAKAPGEGRASHYVSFTRLESTGTLSYGGREFRVTGAAWMDHEFFTHQLEPEQRGWDWVSIQLEDSTELMLFRIRRRDGSVDPFSAGTYVDASGRTRQLGAGDFRMTPSGARHGPYPIEWEIAVPSLGIELRATTPLPAQELSGKSKWSPEYWEGAMDYSGSKQGRSIRGKGYLEMTGYRGPVRM